MSWLDALLGAVTDGTTVRPMGRTMLAQGTIQARIIGHEKADVEHLLYSLLQLTDIKRALAARDVLAEDALAVVEQLLDEKPLLPDPRGEPVPPTARLESLAVLAVREKTTARAVIRSAAAALPSELSFLRKPLEGAADDVAGLYDGALAAERGAVSFAAWDAAPRTILSFAQTVADRGHALWVINPATAFIALLGHQELRDSLAARGIDAKALMGEFAASFPRARWRRDPPASHVVGVGPSLFAVVLRAEHYAADDASNVRLRHLLAGMHEEPLLAPWVEKIAG